MRPTKQPTETQWSIAPRFRNPELFAWEVGRYLVARASALVLRDYILDTLACAAECHRRGDEYDNDTWRWYGRWHRACALALVDYI